MGRILTVIVMSMLLVCAKTQAQREHFVYLQTENMSPFYIKMNGKTISSTYSGYLILGKLKDSTYPIKLGVLGVDEVQDYGLKVEGRNAGYLVKKLGDRGWGIVDLQTNEQQVSMEWSSAIAAEAARQDFMAAEQKRLSDSLANATAKNVAVDTLAATAAAVAVVAVADTATRAEAKPATDTATRIVESPKTEQQRYQDSIAQVIAEKEKELKALQAMMAGATGAAVAASGKNTDSGKTEKSAGEKPVGPVPAGAAVVTAAGVAGVAAGGEGNKEKSKPIADSTVQTAAPSVADTSKAGVVVPAVAIADSAKVSAETMTKPDTTAATADSMATKKATADSVAASPKLQREPCVDILGREEVEGLISKTSSIADGDEIIAQYKKAFKDKCVSTSNLKKICNAMASDVTRYRVLEAAYPHCLDFYAFPDLESLLKDSYYITKFKALVQQ